jgi:molybdenum cofactor biosynthesis enzyme MoaA
MQSPDAVTQIGQAPVRIDLLASITGVRFDDVRAGAETIAIDGLELRVIGLIELRRNKRATGRAKDRLDLRRLEAAHPAVKRKSAKKRAAGKTRKPRPR